jgi:hypothetical protein
MHINAVYYIGRKFDGVRRAPRFAIADWSLYERCVVEDMRSNQIGEGFNNGFQHIVGQAHPPLYKMFEIITRFLRNADIEQVGRTPLVSQVPMSNQVQRNNGKPSFMRTAPYIERARNLRNVLARWDTGYYVSHFDYLLAIANNLNFYN